MVSTAVGVATGGFGRSSKLGAGLFGHSQNLAEAGRSPVVAKFGPRAGQHINHSMRRWGRFGMAASWGTNFAYSQLSPF
ncbi:hypothetical protein [Kitasatospora sp. CB01950]|uniref:hypothetical protein n=1 Tax=Kitasatospora sp. CB01950 TaxID=1703930 RepID=UPI00093E48D9|nr:hypothetical protein [Kitasatospora sp. CB01950]OKI99112.1 hypothetical protein AMK19_31460 [Kitasatospora sp. CB01950]